MATSHYQISLHVNTFHAPDMYNQLFTMHGTTMMFLFAVPMMEGMAIYFVPLMIGTRDVAFPKLNVYGYFIYLFGGLFLYTMFFIHPRPDAGGLAYSPVSGPRFAPGRRVDTLARVDNCSETV